MVSGDAGSSCASRKKKGRSAVSPVWVSCWDHCTAGDDAAVMAGLGCTVKEGVIVVVVRRRRKRVVMKNNAGKKTNSMIYVCIYMHITHAHIPPMHTRSPTHIPPSSSAPYTCCHPGAATAVAGVTISSVTPGGVFHGVVVFAGVLACATPPCGCAAAGVVAGATAGVVAVGGGEGFRGEVVVGGGSVSMGSGVSVGVWCGGFTAGGGDCPQRRHKYQHE